MYSTVGEVYGRLKGEYETIGGVSWFTCGVYDIMNEVYGTMGG